MTKVWWCLYTGNVRSFKQNWPTWILFQRDKLRSSCQLRLVLIQHFKNYNINLFYYKNCAYQTDKHERRKDWQNRISVEVAPPLKKNVYFSIQDNLDYFQHLSEKISFPAESTWFNVDQPIDRYRVFFKYCVFYEDFNIFSGLCFLSSQCVYTRQAGRKPALQQNWQSLKF